MAENNNFLNKTRNYLKDNPGEIIFSIVALLMAIAVTDLNKYPWPVVVLALFIVIIALFYPFPIKTRKVLNFIIGFILGLSIYFVVLKSSTCEIDETDNQSQEDSTQTEYIEVTREVTVVVERIITTTPSPTVEVPQERIVISEIMNVPLSVSGLANDETSNEYIEIYNCSDNDFDVSDIWISDGDGSNGQPDRLVSWASRFSGNIPAEGLVLDTTLIPSHEFALILAPRYAQSDNIYRSQLLEGLIILTILESESGNDLLGDMEGLSGNAVDLDILLLYKGSKNHISDIIDSYGIPDISIGMDPFDISPSYPAQVPLSVQAETGTHGGVRRKELCDPDTTINWEAFTWKERTPGYY